MSTQATRNFVLAALAVYLVVLLALTFVPFGAATDLGGRINLDPFDTINRALRRPGSPGYRLMLGNIAAFIPLGLMLPMLIRRWSAALVLIAAFALSAGIELGQLAVSSWLGYAYRSTDVDDVILNVLGAVIGLASYGILRSLTSLRPTAQT